MEEDLPAAAVYSSSDPQLPGPKVYTSLKKQVILESKAKPKIVIKPKATTVEPAGSVEEASSDNPTVNEAPVIKKKARKPRPKKSKASASENIENVSVASPASEESQQLAPDSSASSVKPAKPVRKPVERPKPAKKLTDAETLELELSQLKIRFPDLNISPATGDSIEVQLTVPILDPEFPFDLEAVRLSFLAPKGYPSAVSPSFSLLNEDIPLNLKNNFKMHMDKAARTLLGQQALRPMLRFLEKNLEMMLTPPSNPSGFKFVAPSPSPSPQASREPRIIEAPKDLVSYRKSDKPDDFEMPEEYYEAMRQLNISISPSTSPLPSSLDSDDSSHKQTTTVESLPLKKVPESRFKPAENIKIEPVTKGAMAGSIQLQLHNTKLKGIGLLVITKLGVLLKCDRCKISTPIDDLRPDVDRIYACKKCTVKSTVHFKFDPVHENNRSAGYLRCRGGMPADMLPSTIQVTCSQCSPDDPNLSTVKIEKVQIGELVSFSCRSCHMDCSVEIGRVDWVPIPGLMEASRPKRGAIPKLPSQIGDPLPDKGTCKHYKKSFRWFRFPCCGKAYPCDTCHDEDASNAGHKAEWATRMICGVCSREMPISQKDCPCGAQPASTRHSSHWEGGKGMRDQTQMSKKDNKKYRNLTKPKPDAK